MPAEAPSLEQLVRFLGHTEIFRGLSDKHLQAIARVTRVVEFEQGEAIVRQGEEGDELYIIASGAATVLVEEPDLGIEQPVLSLGSLQSFGEMSLLTSAPRSATIRADEPTLCIGLARASFDSILAQIPEVAVSISRYLAGRLQQQIQLTGFRFVRLAEVEFDPDVYAVAPHGLLERHQAVPLSLEGDTLTVALTRPNDSAVVTSLRQAIPGLRLVPVACGYEDYLDFLHRVIEPRRTPVHEPVGEVRLLDSEDAPGLFEEVLAAALSRRATAVHFEPGLDRVVVRVRSEGELEPLDVSVSDYAGLLGRVKRACRLDSDRERAPQSGSGRLRAGERVVDFRASTLPTRNGEKLVLTLMSQGAIPSLAGLVPSAAVEQLIRAPLLRPGGAVLVVGPSGSGVTTTLYTLLRECREAHPDRNLVTVESSVACWLDGVVQTEVDESAGVTGLELVRAAVRQDPDLVMISAVTGGETATLALEAAAGGVTVLAGLRADDTGAALGFLRELGVPPYQLAGSVDLVVAQRLLRQICPSCREEGEFSSTIVSNLVTSGLVPAGDKPVLYRGKGCPECGGTGFSGRVACFEVLVLNDFVRELIGGDRPPDAVRRAAMSQKALMEFKSYAGYLLKEGRVTPGEALRYFAG